MRCLSAGSPSHANGRRLLCLLFPTLPNTSATLSELWLRPALPRLRGFWEGAGVTDG